MDYYDAIGGLGPRPKPVPTPPFRLPTDEAGPAPPPAPTFGSDTKLQAAQLANVNPPLRLGKVRVNRKRRGGMTDADAIKSEQGYYGPPTPEMLRPPPLDVVKTDLWGGPPLDVVPTDLWDRQPIDLANPLPQSEGQRQSAYDARRVNAEPGKTFVDRIEDDGTAVLLVPNGNDYTVQNVPAQQGWKEGMYIDMPQERRPPRKRLAVP